MTRVIRTATIQARVLPMVKEASELILWQIGLNMSEAVELFLRRVIVDKALPFSVVAVDDKKMNAPKASRHGERKGRCRAEEPKSAPPPKKN